MLDIFTIHTLMIKHSHIFFMRRKSNCEQPEVNSVLRSDTSVELLQKLSKARPPGEYFLSASLQQLAEMSCLGGEANATLLVSSPSNSAASPPTTTSPPHSEMLSTGHSNIFHMPFHLCLIGNLESLVDLFLHFLCSSFSPLSVCCLLISVSSHYDKWSKLTLGREMRA